MSKHPGTAIYDKKKVETRGEEMAGDRDRGRASGERGRSSLAGNSCSRAA